MLKPTRSTQASVISPILVVIVGGGTDLDRGIDANVPSGDRVGADPDHKGL